MYYIRFLEWLSRDQWSLQVLVVSGRLHFENLLAQVKERSFLQLAREQLAGLEVASTDGNPSAAFVRVVCIIVCFAPVFVDAFTCSDASIHLLY